MQERDERFRQLVDLAPDGLLIHDGDRIVWANAAAVRMAGATELGELVGTPVRRLLQPPYLKALADRLSSADPASWSVGPLDAPARDVLMRLDGSSIPVEVRAVVFLHRDVPAVHLVLRDISVRLALEEASRQLEATGHELARGRALATLAGGVAHELNNMVAIMLGHGHLVLEAEGDAHALRADVGEMMRAAERAAVVTRQMLAFSQQAVYRPEILDLASAVRDMEPALGQLLGPGRRLELRTTFAPTRVDPSHLAQVLLALGENARDATSSTGEVRVTVGIAELSEPVDSVGGLEVPVGRYAECAMTDDGVGLTPEVRARMFDPFFTTKPTGEGPGLGLAAVRGIVAQNGGYVVVESDAGAGATFRLLLPEHGAVPLPQPTPTKRPSRAPATLARSVLVVDDEPVLRRVIVRILQRSGINATHAADGLDALAAIERHGPPDLVLTDIQMPRMGGLDLAKTIRDRWPRVRVLLMSGYSAEYVALNGSPVGRDDLLEKPFSPTQLCERVDQALRIDGAVEVIEPVGTTPNA